MKLKAKLKAILKLKNLALLGCFFVLTFLIPASTAQADYDLNKCQTTSSSSKYCPEAFEFSFTPASLKAGQTGQVSFNFNQPYVYNLLKGQNSVSLNLTICPVGGNYGCTGSLGTLKTYTVKGSELKQTEVLSFEANGPLSKPGNYTIVAASTGNSFQDSPNVWWAKRDITIAAADPASQPTINLSLSSKDLVTNSTVGQAVIAKINLSFIPGPDGRTPTSFNVDCGGATANDKQSLTGSVTSFSCQYDKAAGNHKVVVTAVGVSATKELNVIVTGTESDQLKQGGASPVDGVIILIKQIIQGLLGIIQELIYAVFFYFVAPFIQAMLSIHPYTDAFVAVIYPGWIVVRNLCNMLFVVALIVIALATLFRVESYQFRHLLVQLIIAALLINFSLVIGQIVLGLADTVQAQFLPANVTVIRSLAGNLMVNNWRDAMLNTGNPFENSTSSNLADVIQPLFFLALSLGSFAVFCAIMVFLVIRIIALWILLLISPVAYACGVLPATASYRATWWQNFIKYAFFTPIMAFFLNLTAVIANQYGSNGNPILRGLTDEVVTNSLGGSGIASFVFKVASNIMLLIFLVAGLKVAEMAGVFGAAGITKIAQGGIFAPFAAAGWGMQKAGGYAGRKWNDFTSGKFIKGETRKVGLGNAIAFAALNPVAFAKAWSKESERKKHAAEEKAEMAGLEVVQQRFDGFQAFLKGSYKIEPHVLQHEKHHSDEKAKNLQNLSRENVAKTAAEYFKLGNSEDDKAYKRGIIKLAMAKGYIDDVVQEAHKTDEGREMIAKMAEIAKAEGNEFVEGVDWNKVKKAKRDSHNKIELDDNGNVVYEKDENGDYVYEKDSKGNYVMGMEYNHNTRRAMYKAMFGVNSHGHLNDHAAMALIAEEGEKEGMDTGHLEYMTDMYFDNETGSYEFYDLKKVKKVIGKDDQGKDITIDTYISDGEKRMAGAEIAKRNSRTQAGIAWHSLMSSDGGTLYKDVFSKISKAVAENPTFMQERTANMLVAGTTNEDDIKEIRNHFIETGNLIIKDKKALARLEEIRKTDQKAFVSIISRFANDANVQAIERRTKRGFAINGDQVHIELAQALLPKEGEAKPKS